MITMYTPFKFTAPAVIYDGTNGYDVIRLLKQYVADTVDKNCCAYSFVADGMGRLYEKIYFDINDNKISAKEAVKDTMYIIIDDKLYTFDRAHWSVLFEEMPVAVPE